MAILAAPFVVLAFAGIALVLLVFRKWKAALVLAFLALLVNGCTEQIPLRFSPEYTRHFPWIRKDAAYDLSLQPS